MVLTYVDSEPMTAAKLLNSNIRSCTLDDDSQRPVSPTSGLMIWNGSTANFEYYNGTDWIQVI